jgi:hypothetical protein
VNWHAVANFRGPFASRGAVVVSRQGFTSGAPELYFRLTTVADVAELADALDSKSSTRESVWVRPPPSAPLKTPREHIGCGRSQGRTALGTFATGDSPGLRSGLTPAMRISGICYAPVTFRSDNTVCCRQHGPVHGPFCCLYGGSPETKRNPSGRQEPVKEGSAYVPTSSALT